MPFDARNYAPSQGMPKHPFGRFPAIIHHTENKAKALEGGGFSQTTGYLSVTFKTPAGETTKNYNLWNESKQAVDIAHAELSALCYATGRYNITPEHHAPELRGAQLQIEVTEQRKNPDYLDIRVFDLAGNDPTKAGSGAAARPGGMPGQMQPGAPMQGGAPQQAGPFATLAATVAGQQAGPFGAPTAGAVTQPSMQASTAAFPSNQQQQPQQHPNPFQGAGPPAPATGPQPAPYAQQQPQPSQQQYQQPQQQQPASQTPPWLQ